MKTRPCMFITAYVWPLSSVPSYTPKPGVVTA
jgi:hypothetical protein